MQPAAIDPVTYARRWKILAVLALSLLIIGLDNTVLNVALPTLQTHFAASGSTLQWIVDAYLLAFAGVLLTMGTLGDRLGRKRVLQSGLLLFGTASVLAALAQNADQLIALRAIMGIAGAMIMPATLSVIMDVFPREERAKAIGIWSAVAGIGIGLGPFVGGLLLEWSSWSSVFWLNVPIVAVAVIAGLALVPESRDPHPGSFDLRGAALSIATLVTLVYGIIEATPRGWTDPLVLGCFGAAAVLGVAFVAWERKATAPMLPLTFFSDPRFTVASTGIGLVFFALMGSVFAFTQFLQFAMGFSALEAGAAMLPLALGLVVGSGASNHLTGRLGRTRVIAGGLFGVGAVLSTSLVWTPDMAAPMLCLVTFGLALSMGFVMAPSTTTVMSAVPEAKAGVGSAMSDVTRQVGGALGVAVIGSLIATAYSQDMHGAPAGAADSVGGAHAVAEQVGGAAGRAIAESAGQAFTDALGIGLTAAAAVAFAGAILVLLRLPDNRAAASSLDAPQAGTHRGRLAGAAAVAACLVAGGLLTATNSGPDIAAAAAPPPVASLQQGVNRLVAAGAPGAILLVRDGDRTLQLTGGLGDVARGTPMRADNHFKIASLTKTYTATVVLQLVGEGKLRLTDSVHRWLPGLVPNGRHITIRQLLNHTSGLADFEADPRYLKPYLGGDFGYYWSPRALVKMAVSHKPLFAPGKTPHTSYSNTNYVLAGLIAEAATGNTFAAELKRRIFKPLGLTHTSYPSKPGLPAPYAHGYLVVQQPPATDVTGLSPSLSPHSGAIVSTATDVADFYRGLLSGRLLKAKQLKAMKTTISEGSHVDIPGQRYGLGLELFPTSCGDALGHNGVVPGYETFVFSTANGGRQALLMINHDAATVPRAAGEAFFELIDAAFCSKISLGSR